MILRTNRFSVGALIAAAALFSAASWPASAWTRAEIDAAVKDKVDISVIRSCAANPNEKLVQRVETKDFNKDGVDEIVVYSVIYSLSQCAGLNGRQADLLISDGTGGWQDTVIPQADDLKLQARPDSVWPDFAADDYSECLPVWRHNGKAYGEWKHCNMEGRLETVNVVAVAAAPPPQMTREGDNGPYPVQIVNIKTFEGMPFDHNGSMMLVNPDKGMIVYLDPKPAIAKTVKPGTVLFRGKPWDMNGDTSGLVLEGMAFTFKRGCDAAGYNVRGRFSLTFGMRQFELEGAAPVRSKKGCAVPMYDVTSANAKLKFDLAWD